MSRPARHRLAIRKARPPDLDAVDAIEVSSFTVDRFPRRSFARLLASPSAELMLAESEGAALGYVLLLFRKGAKAARLYSLAASPEARGKGIGGKLVQAAVESAIEKGCDRLRLEVRRSNGAAIRLYRRAGFNELDMMPAYYDDGEDGLRMELRLDRMRRPAR